MLRMIGMGLGVISAVVTGLIFYQSADSFNRFSKHALHSEVKEHESSEKPPTPPSEGAGEHGGGGHGGGHGEEQSAAKASEHGGGGRETASSKMVPFLSLDELFTNINEEKKNHTLAIKVDVEFFDVEAKQTFKTNQPAVKHLIIQTSREQEYDQLATLSGKLYYKELLIRRINEYFQKPLVKDVHFASFFLQ